MTNTNPTSPLARLARHVLEAEGYTDALKRRAYQGYSVPLGVQLRAESSEEHARQAFAIACGQGIGTTEFTQALARALAETPGDTAQQHDRLLIETANAILETLETCAPISAKPNNPGWRAMAKLTKCHLQIASLLTRAETETTA